MNERLAPLPATRATNAYELMEDVNRIILEEPARMDMRKWISAFRSLTEIEQRNEDVSEGIFPIPEPACGTVACYSGWCAILVGDRTMSTYGEQILAPYKEEPSRVNHALRNTLENAFYGTTFWDKAGRMIRPGTLKYAKMVVARFKAIMDEYETELKSTPITIKRA